jgi:site-specific DNA recombinase
VPRTVPSVSHLHRRLTNKLYKATIVWSGEEYPGGHEPIVAPEPFDAVQAVIRKHLGGCVCERVHQHYLRGTSA